jgi:hypothetical protein
VLEWKGQNAELWTNFQVYVQCSLSQHPNRRYDSTIQEDEIDRARFRTMLWNVQWKSWVRWVLWIDRKMLWKFDTRDERRLQNGILKLLNWSHKLNLREGLYQPFLWSIRSTETRPNRPLLCSIKETGKKACLTIFVVN